MLKNENNPAIFLFLFILFSIIFFRRNCYIMWFGGTEATANLQSYSLLKSMLI